MPRFSLPILFAIMGLTFMLLGVEAAMDDSIVEAVIAYGSGVIFFGIGLLAERERRRRGKPVNTDDRKKVEE